MESPISPDNSLLKQKPTIQPCPNGYTLSGLENALYLSAECQNLKNALQEFCTFFLTGKPGYYPGKNLAMTNSVKFHFEEQYSKATLQLAGLLVLEKGFTEDAKELQREIDNAYTNCRKLFTLYRQAISRLDEEYEEKEEE